MDTYRGVALGVECAWPAPAGFAVLAGCSEPQAQQAELSRAEATLSNTHKLPPVNQEGSHP